MSPLWLLLLAVSGPVTAAGPALAGPPAGEPVAEINGTHVLVITGQLDRLEGDRGSGGRVDYAYSLVDGNGVTLAAAGYELAGSRWAYGEVGGGRALGSRRVLSGGGSLGSGERGRESFGYERYGLGLALEAIEKRLVLTLEDEYYDIDTTRGNLLTLRAGATLSPRLTVEVHRSESLSGNLDSDFTGLRLDGAGSRFGWLAGGGAGRSRPEILDLVGSAASTDLREIFAGVRVPVSGSQLVLVVDYLDLDGVDRLTVTLGVQLAFTSKRWGPP